VLAGSGTVGLEVEEDAPDADAVIVPVGGGGLISGVQAAIGDRMRVIAVEPELSQAHHAGIAAGHPVTVEPTSIADGLSAPQCGRLPIELCSDLERVLVTEDEIKEAFRFLYERAKLAVEPAGATAAAALLAHKVEAVHPVVIVSGGNVATEIASGILGSR
jgi:threonine dehydratase